MQTEIPLYKADGEFCDWITPARMARLEKLDLIQIVRHKKGHVSRCILRQQWPSSESPDSRARRARQAAESILRTFQAIVTKDHAAGERIRPTIWPTPVLREGDDLAFDILAVASPDPGSDLTVVIQT
jgi:hypothetical protein